jgi:hypothetical protein
MPAQAFDCGTGAIFESEVEHDMLCEDCGVRSDALGELGDALRGLGVDELRILRFVAKRLHAGAKQYGLWSLKDDKRNWRREIAEEMADALVYASAADAQKEGQDVRPT